MNKLSKDEKIARFQNEIDAIKNETIKDATVKILTELVPDYFWEVAASSTGKYHPSYALGEGGLYRHTLAAVRIAIGMFPLTSYTDNEKDLIIAALIFHDGFKHGPEFSKYARADHPVVAAQQVKFYCDSYLPDEYGEELGTHLYNLIITHMGQWNTDWKTKKEIMPKPSTSMQRYVHMCDYLASRKYLEFKFEENV